MAWRCFIQTGFIAADRTLTTAIKRVPAGQILRFQYTKNSAETYTWFDPCTGGSLKTNRCESNCEG